jgi:Amidohydrolase family
LIHAGAAPRTRSRRLLADVGAVADSFFANSGSGRRWRRRWCGRQRRRQVRGRRAQHPNRDRTESGRARCSVAHNPISNQKLGAGIAPFRKLMDAGVNVALGTDGISSNDTARMLDVMHVAAILHKVTSPDYTSGALCHSTPRIADLKPRCEIGSLASLQGKVASWVMPVPRSACAVHADQSTATHPRC